MKLLRLVTVALMFALCAVAFPPPRRMEAQEVKLKFKTEVQVNQAGGGDLEVWDDEFAVMAPTGLYFRWRTSEAWATAGTWQISERPLGLDTSAAAMMHVIRQGPVKLNQEKRGDYAGFSISLAGLVAPKPPKTPKKYYLRVVPLDARGKIVGPPSPPVVITYREPGPPPTIDVSYDDRKPMKVRIALEKFKVHTIDESDSIEPYLLIAFVFADGTSVSAFGFQSSSVQVIPPPTVSNNNLVPTGVDYQKSFYIGEEVTIEPHRGTVERTVWPLPGLNSEPVRAMKLSRFGVVVVALEQDDAPAGASKEANPKLVAALQAHLDAAVRATTRQTMDSLPKRMDDALANLLTVENMEKLPRGWVVDSDDVIGVKSVFYSYYYLRNAGWITFDMDFRRGEVHFSLKGKMQVVK